MFSQRPAGEEVHLQSPDQAHPIAGLNPASRFGIDAPNHPVKKPNAAPVGHPLEPAPALRISAGAWKQSARQSPVIEAGPSHNNWPSRAMSNVTDRGSRFASVAGSRVVFGRIGHVDQVMRNAALLVDRDFVGADVEATVNSRRVATDNLAPVLLSQIKRQGALS